MKNFSMESSNMKMKPIHSVMAIVTALAMSFFCSMALAGDAENNTLNAIDYAVLPGGKVQLHFAFEKPVVAEPKSFTIEQPPRVSIDLENTALSLDKKALRFDSGVVNSVRAVGSNDRARIVVTLNSMVPYEVRTEANSVYVNFGVAGQQASASVARLVTGHSGSTIADVDFRRGTDGSGKIKVMLSDVGTIINMEEKGEKVVVDFINASLPEKFIRRLDVTDFATPIHTVDAYNVGQNARMVIGMTGDYEHMAYQAGNEFSIDVKPLSREQVEDKKKDQFGYSGEKLSLNFQNIEVRAVLQLLADFTGLNVVASDSVQGNITLRLKNVPWDQALDIILRTRGLGMRKTGNVVLIAPNAEIVAREREELEAQKQRVDLAPVFTQYHQINYAKAADIANLLKGEKNTILTERGSVSIDDRTNTLMVLESREKQEEVAALIAKLDIPVRQVMIESRIVIATDDFGRDIGVRTGVTQVGTNDTNGIIGTTGSAVGADVMTASAISNNTAGTGPYPIEMPLLNDRYNVNLPAGGSAGRIALALLGSDYLVDLELSALQTEGKGEVLANPRVITSNQTKAVIEQGVEVPYQEASSSGATTISFKKAVLSLEVTPQITPDDRVVMDLNVNSDSIGGIYSGIPSINTRSVETQVLVNNGDTVVLGGVYEHNTSEGETKVPFFGDIPLLGNLFKSRSRKESKGELLIFVTPKILDDAMKVAP